MIHIIDRLPVSHAELKHTSIGDTVLFTENALFAIRSGENEFENLRSLFTHINFCVLIEDICSKGVSHTEIPTGISVIDQFDVKDLKDNTNAFRSCN